MLSACHLQALLALKRAHLDRKIGRGNIHVNMADAVAHASNLVATQRRLEAVEGV